LARGKLACPSSQKKARHGEAVGPLSKLLAEVSGSPQVILLKISDKLACPSSQKKASHGEAVGPLSKLLAEVSGSPQVILLKISDKLACPSSQIKKPVTAKPWGL
jgi:hypothetical protein